MPPRGDLDVMDAFNQSQDINPLDDPEIKDLLEEFHQSQDTFDLSQDTFCLEDDDPDTQTFADQSHLDNGSANFDRWKSSFLKRLDAILAEAPEESRIKALASYDKFSQQMDDFLRIIQHVLDCIDRGSISATSVGVKGVRALNELKQGATDTMFALMDWMPTTVKEEQAVRYTKWQLGAVLVRKGFDVYETMLMARDMLKQAKEECVDQVADHQTLDAIDYYDRQIVRFCDVMADLGLYELMVQAHDQLGEKRRQQKRYIVLKDRKEGGRKVDPKVKRHEYNNDASDSTQKEEDEPEDAWEHHGNGDEEDKSQPKSEDIRVSEEVGNAQGVRDENPSDNEEGEEQENVDQPQRDDEDILATKEDSNASAEETGFLDNGKEGEEDHEDSDQTQPEDDEVQMAEIDDNAEDGHHDEEQSISEKREDDGENENIQVAEEEDDNAQIVHDDKPSDNEAEGEDEESCEADNEENVKTHPKDDEIQMTEFDGNPYGGHHDEEQSISDDKEDNGTRMATSTDNEPQAKEENIQVAEKDDNAPSDLHDESSFNSEEELREDADDKDQPHPYDEDNEDEEEEDLSVETSHPDVDNNSLDGAAENDVNTECDDPDDYVNPPGNGKGDGNGLSRPHVRLQFGLPVNKTYNRKIKHDDCILVPELFGAEDDSSNYDNLRDEIAQLTTQDRTRMVCDNAVASSAVQMVVDKLVEYFGMEHDSVTIELEMYRDATDTKPASHDIIAYKSKHEKSANISIAASFGAERDLALEAREGGTPIHVPQRNNGVFTIGRDVNVRFVNSIIKGEEASSQGRICIVVRGQVPSVVEEGGSPDLLEAIDEE